MSSDVSVAYGTACMSMNECRRWEGEEELEV
jgi:hypothetical protein